MGHNISIRLANSFKGSIDTSFAYARWSSDGWEGAHLSTPSSFELYRRVGVSWMGHIDNGCEAIPRGGGCEESQRPAL